MAAEVSAIEIKIYSGHNQIAEDSWIAIKITIRRSEFACSGSIYITYMYIKLTLLTKLLDIHYLKYSQLMKILLPSIYPESRDTKAKQSNHAELSLLRHRAEFTCNLEN